MLLRHAWLAPLMRPPTEAEGAAAPEASESPESDQDASPPTTEDKQVADWVHQQLERRQNGLLQNVEKPALHAVALDRVATSPTTSD